MATDPVCGMQVDPQTGLHAQRDGQDFYFCSEHCRQKFLTEPTQTPSAVDGSVRFPAKESGSQSENETDQYFCPMHPEVTQSHSGSCPKCGMALEAAPSLAAPRSAQLAIYLSDAPRDRAGSPG